MVDMITNKDLQDVLFNLGRASTFTKGWRDNIEQWRRLYDFKHYELQPLPGESQFADPTYTNTVDLAVAIILANPITWRAAPWRPTANAQKLASQVEKFLIGTEEANTDRNGYDQAYEIILHFVRDAGAVLYTYWDDNIAASSKSTGEFIDTNGNVVAATVYEECPLRIQVIDPMSIKILAGGKERWMMVAREEKQTLYDIYTRFGVLPQRYSHLTGDITAQLTTEDILVDYWDVATISDGDVKKQVVRNGVLFGNEFIPGYELKTMKKYRSLPYTIGFYKPTDRLDSTKWAGIISPLIGSVRHLETSINRRQRQIDMFSSMPFVSKTLKGRAVNVDPGMGKVVNLSTEEDFGFPVWQGNPPDVERQIDFFRSRVQQSGFSDVFYGSGASAVSGYALSQLGDQNRIRLEQPVTHLERFYMWAAQKIVEITLDNAEPGSYIRMYGKVKGEPFAGAVCVSDLSGQHITCEIVPEFPNERVRNHAMATQVRGIISDHRIMEDYLRVQQPDEEFDVRMIEQAQNSPIIMNYNILRKFKEMADAGDEMAKLALESMLQNGVPGISGRPKEPNNPEQSLGMPNRAEPMGGEPTNEGEQLANAAPNLAGGIYGSEF